jgi:DNA-binding transcriptional LysR family regulator
MVLQAAEAGQGVALGWSYITDPLIADGRLVSPIGRALDTEDGYYVCTIEDDAIAPAAAQFVAWIKSEAAALA